MIASNYRKHPEAAALQLPLPFAHRLVWALPRPGARILRAIRVARGRAFETTGRIAYPVKAAIPQWWKDAKRRARELAQQVREACMVLLAEVHVAVTNADTVLLGFNYERELEQRRTALDAANCPKCGRPRFGWTPDWKRGVWRMTCPNGHDWTLPVPESP